jgi:hypothetical protein
MTDTDNLAVLKIQQISSLKRVIEILTLTTKPPKEIRSIKLPTFRVTPSETKRFRALIKQLGFAGPAQFGRHCMEKLFEIFDSGDLPERRPVKFRRALDQ